MGRCCCICKIEIGPDDEVGVHPIPKDVGERAKWFLSIGRIIHDTDAVICSKHFKSKDVYYKSFYTGVRQFLRPCAVPHPEILPLSLREDLFDINGHLIGKVTSQKKDEIEILNDHSYILKNNVRTEKSNGAQCDIETKTNKETQTDDVFGGFQNLSKYIFKNKETSTANDTKKKMKLEIPKAKQYIIHRHIGDLNREDFTSDESWNIVRKYFEDTKKSTRTMNQKLSRLNDKVEGLTKSLQFLKIKYNETRKALSDKVK